MIWREYLVRISIDHIEGAAPSAEVQRNFLYQGTQLHFGDVDSDAGEFLERRQAAMAVVGGVFSEMNWMVVPLACFQASSLAMPWARAVRSGPAPNNDRLASPPIPFNMSRRLNWVIVVFLSWVQVWRG